MTTLASLLRAADELDDDGLVYAAPPWDAESEAVVIEYSEEVDKVAPPGLEYVLEVRLIKEVLSVWSQWRNGRQPNDQEALEALRYYAQNDAYISLDMAP